MKKIIMAIIATLTMGAAAHAYVLPASYRAVYCYPTGSYWVKQFSNPWNAAYYAQPSVNAYWTARMGAGTPYC